MNIGMLWFDNSSDNIAIKVARASGAYQEKFGQAPTVCYVHPCMFEGILNIGGVEVKTNRSILKNHFWLGVDEAKP
jgi:hypothetical protein